MNLSQFVIRVEKFEREFWFGDCVYFAALDRLQPVQADLKKLTKDEMTHVVKMFLVQWGSMTRIVNQKHIDWGKLAENLRENAGSLEHLSDKELLHCNFNDLEVRDSINGLYESLDQKWSHTQVINSGKNAGQKRKVKSGIGPTSISKTLHLLNPRLFIMWDENVRNDLEFKSGASEYLRFLTYSKDLLISCLSEGIDTSRDDKEVVQDIVAYSKSRLNDEILTMYKQKTVAKLIDEYYIISSPKKRIKIG